MLISYKRNIPKVLTLLTSLGQTTIPFILTARALLTKESNVSETLWNVGIQQQQKTPIIIKNRYPGNTQFFYNLLAFLLVLFPQIPLARILNLFFTHRSTHIRSFLLLVFIKATASGSRKLTIFSLFYQRTVLKFYDNHLNNNKLTITRILF